MQRLIRKYKFPIFFEKRLDDTFRAKKKCGVKLTPPVLIEDHTMHLTPVLNLWVLVQHPVVLF